MYMTIVNLFYAIDKKKFSKFKLLVYVLKKIKFKKERFLRVKLYRKKVQSKLVVFFWLHLICTKFPPPFSVD